MSSKGDPALRCQSLHVIFILVLCILSLAVHFVAEGLSPRTGVPGFHLTRAGGQTSLVHEHGEDQFVLAAQEHTRVEHSIPGVISLKPAHSLSALIPPILPPPNS